MIEYLNWAKAQLSSDHEPSVYDWENMSMAEMSERALAICAAARATPYAGAFPLICAFRYLEKMAEAIAKRYDYPRPRGW